MPRSKISGFLEALHICIAAIFGLRSQKGVNPSALWFTVPLIPLSSLGKNEQQYMKSLLFWSFLIYLCSAPSVRSRSYFCLPLSFAHTFHTSYNLTVSPPPLCSVSLFGLCVHVRMRPSRKIFYVHACVYVPLCASVPVSMHTGQWTHSPCSFFLELYWLRWQEA